MSEQKNLIPLSHPQRRIWYSEKLHPGTSMWSNAGTLKIKGKLNVEVLEKAILAFIKNNDTIRLRITEVNSVPYQYIAPFTDQKIDILDFSGTGLRQLFEWDQAQTIAPMSVLNSCLYYFAIVKLPGGKGALYAKVHHIISDALSMVLLSDQILENYRALLSGETPEDKAPGSYADFVYSERSYFESRRFIYDKQYWNQRFSAPPEPTVLKEKKESYYGTRARRKTFVLPARLSEQIRDYCKSSDMSVFAFFLSALSTYIFRVSGKRDIIISAPVANRTTTQAKTTIGMFVSIVPVRIEIDENLPFYKFVQVVSNEWFSVLKHQKYPYNLLLQDLRKTHKGLDSLFDITLSYQNAVFNKNTQAFIDEERWHFNGHQVTSLNIHINNREGGGRFIMDYDHLVPLFSLKEIEYIHEHMLCIITDVLSHHEKTLSQINMLTSEEYNRILCQFNDTDTAFPEGESLADLWNAQVSRTPESIAVVSGSDSITYAKLDEKAGAVARRLHALGLRPGSIVGVMAERSLDLFICILGVLKAGCAFLPINAELPADRVCYMLGDCGARALLISSGLKELSCQNVDLEIITTDMIKTLKGNAPKIKNKPGDLAYVIYTSGSTGAPKGVAIEHHSIVHFLYALCSIMDFSPGNRVLCAASISFDLFIMEFLPTLISGATLVLAAEHETAIPRNLIQLIEKNKVNKLMFTPSRMQLLLSDELARKYMPNVREIMLGGDVLSEQLLKQIKSCTRARILNFYGPTEITIAATYKDVTEAKSVNIGKPMPNTKVYILDSHKNPVPIGVYGELYISGRGLARGYINKPELNAASFIDNPFVPGEKMYRTGDLARWYPLGDIEYLGRVDQQVKIRGFRIELGEIENRLVQVPGIQSCAVIDRVDETGRKYLCAYICGKSIPTRSQIISFLSRDLPAYMLPSYFVILDELPLNFSGKLDRKLLPDPLKHSIITVVDDFDPPVTNTEKVLASIWSRILKVHPIGRNDSFFDIGGDSLSIIAAMGEVQNVYLVDVSLEDIYRAPTLKACAECIDNAEKHNYSPIRPVPVRRYYPVSPAQMRMYVLSVGNQAHTAYNIPFALQLTGPLNIQALEKAFHRLIKRHDVLRTGYVLRGNELCQQIRKHVNFSLDYMECPASRLRSVLKGLNKPFDLAAPPLMRATVLRTKPENHILYINLHHSICDARSAEILLEELSILYSKEIPIGKDIDYKDYTLWHLEFLESEAGKSQSAYWNAHLQGELPLLNLQTDYPRGAKQTFEGARVRFEVPGNLLNRMREFAREQNVTLFMLLLGAYNVFLQKYTAQEDIIVGVPVAGRTRDELRNMFGMFVNTLPVRNNPKSDMTFIEFLQTVHENCLSAYKNSDYPFDLIIRDLGLERSLTRNPLFDTMLSYQTIGLPSLQLEHIKTALYPFDPGIAKMDLSLEVNDYEDFLQCEFEYNTALFKKSTVVQMARHFKNLLQTLTEEAQIPLRQVQVLTPEEIRELTWMNFKKCELDTTKSIQNLFEERVFEHPEKPALIVNGETMTFAQLNDRANQIAWRLIDLGVKPNQIVAVCMHRSFDLVAGILGVLKAGAAYLPVDPEYPQERIRFVLSDSHAAVLFTDCTDFDGCLDTTVHTNSIPHSAGRANPGIPESPGDIAYVIYTSGSTGLPKGVIIPRVALLNYHEGAKPVHKFKPEDVCISITTIAFDIFVEDALLPLFCGCTLVLSSDEESNQPHLVAKLVETQKADYIQATPTRMLLMMSDPSFKKAISRLRIVALGGEPVPL
ncbi:MAG: amino acid adenylation domain-containing protein, partial [Bacillota bacterium]